MKPGARQWLWLIPLVAGVVAYAPAPWGQLVWDDGVVTHYQLESFETLGDVLRPPDDIVRWSYAYYRPMVVVSYLADARLFGTGAAGPHIANVIFHLLATFLVFLLARRLLRGRPQGEAGAVLAATVFAVHPIHTESVSWIAGRSDVLAAAFLLSALLLALRWRDSRSIAALVLSPLFFLLALLSKETGITALALVPLALVLAPPDAQRPARSRALLAAVPLAAGFAAVTALYWWLRQNAGIPALMPREMSGAERVQRSLEALAYYLGKAVFPWPQSAVVPWEMVPGRAAAATILLVAAALLGWSAWRWIRRGDGAWLLAAGWFCVTITVPLWAAMDAVSNTPLAERHLYLPSVGVAIGAGLLFAAARARGWRVPAALVAALVIAAYLAGSIARGFVWRTDLALWTDATSGAAVDGLSWTNLGTSQAFEGQDDLALESFERAIADPRLEPRWVCQSRNGMGLIALKRGNTELADEQFRAAIEAYADFAEPFHNLGKLYIARAQRLQGEGDFAGRDRAADTAINTLSTVSLRFPNYAPPRLLLAGFLLEYGQMLEAEGRTGPALRRYQAGLDQLDRRGKAASARAGKPPAGDVDIDELRRQLAAAVERLRAAGVTS